jgi:formylglycine-generating enzyme
VRPLFPGPEDEESPPSSRTSTPVVVSTDAFPASTATPPRTKSARRIAVASTLAVFALTAFIVGGTDANRASPKSTEATLSAAGLGAKAKGFGISGLEELSWCPDEMALVEKSGVSVCVDKWEAAVVEVLAGGKEQLWSPYTPVAEGRNVKAVSRPDMVPQGYISRNQAEKACAAAEKRLCTSEEWVAACEGPNGTTYPYGEVENPNACNTHGANPIKRLFGTSKKNWSQGPMNHPWLNKMPGTLAKTGAFAACTNDYGVHDMVGNLHEWTADTSGTFRGGYYLDTSVNGKGCGYATTAHSPVYHDYSTGFRCCRDAQ